MTQIYIDGGLGNQLFQLAWAIYLKEKYASNITINLSLLMKKKQHGFIDFRKIFNIEKNTEIKISFYSPFLFQGYQGKAFRLLMRKLKKNNLGAYFLYDFNAEMKLHQAQLLRKCKHQFGYFQFVDSALYCRDIFIDEIKKNRIYKKESIDFYRNKVGIHIRRGDFLGSHNDKHDVITVDFIYNAMSDYPTDTSFVIFSDDMSWVKKNIAGENIYYSNEKNAYDDLYALSYCSSYILSGSTFGWWAAFLNDDYKKIKIIFPEHKAQFISKESNTNIGWNYKYV